jgi:prefoldin subunit 5
MEDKDATIEALKEDIAILKEELSIAEDTIKEMRRDFDEIDSIARKY